MRSPCLLAAALSLAAGCSSAPFTDDAGANPDFAPSATADLAAPPGADLSFPRGADLAGLAQSDLSTLPGPDMSSGGGNGMVGPGGGTVDRLYFAFHGDTRPDNPDDTANYPTDIITAIYKREAAAGVQFAVDLGDHLNSTVAMEAQAQMGLYMKAAQSLGKPTFMTMGNHECSIKGFCDNTDPDQAAYLAALKPISASPYYSIDIKTSSGTATFIFIADNTWDKNQSAWLEATLKKADASSKYTFVMRHHPLGYAKLSVPDENAIIQAHKYSLLLVSHQHLYSRDPADKSGRTVILGCGGASLDPSQQYYGFGTVAQEKDDSLTVSIYDQASNMIQDTFSVSPK